MKLFAVILVLFIVTVTFMLVDYVPQCTKYNNVLELKHALLKDNYWKNRCALEEIQSNSVHYTNEDKIKLASAALTVIPRYHEFDFALYMKIGLLDDNEYNSQLYEPNHLATTYLKSDTIFFNVIDSTFLHAKRTKNWEMVGITQRLVFHLVKAYGLFDEGRYNNYLNTHLSNNMSLELLKSYLIEDYNTNSIKRRDWEY